MAGTGLLSDSSSILPNLLMDPNSATARFAWGYARKRFVTEKWAWVEELPSSRWTADQVAKFGAFLDPGRKTWDWVKLHGDDAYSLYWKTALIYPIEDRSDLQYAVAQLLGHQRPFAALQAIHLVLHRMPDLPADLLFGTLEATLRPNADPRPQDVGFDIVEVLQNLQNRKPPVDRGRLAQLEWAFIEVLDGRRATAETLHTELANDPAFFAELFKSIFRSRTEIDAPKVEPSEQERRRAMSIYKLLHSWKQLPGFQSTTQTIDGEALWPGLRPPGICAANPDIWRFVILTSGRFSPARPTNLTEAGLASRFVTQSRPLTQATFLTGSSLGAQSAQCCHTTAHGRR